MYTNIQIIPGISFIFLMFSCIKNRFTILPFYATMYLVGIGVPRRAFILIDEIIFYRNWIIHLNDGLK